ncbi:MAG: hypothetical protein ABSA75_13315 [Candidatus Bathyarchaeia archaeon]|jgi:hypothetical protein
MKKHPVPFAKIQHWFIYFPMNFPESLAKTFTINEGMSPMAGRLDSPPKNYDQVYSDN